MKIYSSEEGRVRTTAADFAKGCLDVEGEHLTPIMVSMVHCHRQADYMLDNTSKAMEMLKNVKARSESFSRLSLNSRSDIAHKGKLYIRDGMVFAAVLSHV
mgnify:CR=1 FL=1